MPPGEKTLRPFGAQKLLVGQKAKDLPSEELSQPRVVDPRDFVEEVRLEPSSGISKTKAFRMKVWWAIEDLNL